MNERELTHQFYDLKLCKRCNTLKPVSEWQKNSSNKSGLGTWCKECFNRYRRENRHRYEQKNRLWSLYKITPDEYDAILERQDGVCAICKEPERWGGYYHLGRLSVDHCHDTKVVRGLLCKGCNFMLGYAKDEVGILASAISYLENFSDE